MFSLILMGWMGFIGFMGGIEGTAYPAPIPAAVVSIVFLVVKVIVDVENALTKGRKRRRKKVVKCNSVFDLKRCINSGSVK